ncbi:MAG: trehalose-phosphatase [Deltaproteobacteria bacterium]|nr:trehalose-phosphatase [Deltaproteobacteria bacterium]MCW5807525.1 trehalose-phosphatase [Deltaproteobacteria bacterium]
MMKYILSPDQAGVLARVAHARALIAFDFDGTLAPIVPDRTRAAMRDSTRALLASLARLYPVAVVSGRARSDVAARMEPIELRHVVGNHGMECDGEHLGFTGDLAAVRATLARELAGAPGVEIEDKRLSLSVHYRAAPSHAEALARIERAIEEVDRPIRVIGGKLVTNVLPAGATNKGDVMLELVEREHVDVAVYVGDDVTDEDVFELDRPDRIVALRVGEAATSAADFYLREQDEIDQLLARLVELRSGV